MHKFRDPIHGFIEVSNLEKKIIDSAPFQRLRNIKQLATTYLVYHGAEHTRFGHSVGTMHLVTRAFDSVMSKTSNLFADNSQINDVIVIWYRQILRLIALTHDLGHAPFSHASEDLFPQKIKHEHYTKMIIEEPVISQSINEIGIMLQKELIEKLELIAKELQTTSDELIKKHKIRPITPQLIWTIYGEKPRIDDEYIWPDFVFLKSFMDSELDCDKMDYLLRDSLYCGVTYGKYDLDRLISTLSAYKNKDENILSLAISSGGIQAFEEFVLARYFMFIQVYFHKSRRYFDRLLVEGIKEILPDGKYPEDVDEYLKWDDVRIIHEMKQSNKSYSQQYIARKPMTCIFETPAHTENSEKIVAKMLLENLQEKFLNTEFLFDDVDKKAHKLLPSTYSSEDDSGGEIKVIDRHTQQASNIMEHSRILLGIIDKIYICRIYANGNNINEIKEWTNSKWSKYSK